MIGAMTQPEKNFDVPLRADPTLFGRSRRHSGGSRVLHLRIAVHVDVLAPVAPDVVPGRRRLDALRLLCLARLLLLWLLLHAQGHLLLLVLVGARVRVVLET